jgi:hypothetical protein
MKTFKPDYRFTVRGFIEIAAALVSMLTVGVVRPRWVFIYTKNKMIFK